MMADFIYCLNSSTIKPTPILEKIRIAGEAGYRGIELWHDDIDAHVAGGGTVQDVKKAVDDFGLDVPTTIFLKGWFDTTGAEHQTALDECRRRMEQASAVGAVHCVGGPPHDPVLDYELGAKNYGELLQIGIAEFGVRPSMEYLGFAQKLNTIEDALEIMVGSGHADATMIVDPFHCWVGGGPIESLQKLTAAQIGVSHFNDAPAAPDPSTQRDPDRVMPGDGAIDLKLYCDCLRSIGYTRWLSLELFNTSLWARDPREVAVEGLEKMRSVAES